MKCQTCQTVMLDIDSVIQVAHLDAPEHSKPIGWCPRCGTFRSGDTWSVPVESAPLVYEISESMEGTLEVMTTALFGEVTNMVGNALSVAFPQLLHEIQTVGVDELIERNHRRCRELSAEVATLKEPVP